MSQTERIIKGAEGLFLTSGIRSITMDDIARYLGMSKKTIYQFFKDKNELVSALTRKKLQEDEDQINDIVANSNNVIEEMMNMNKCSEDIFSRINPVVIHDLQKYHPEAWNDFQKFKAEFLTQKMEELLTKGMGQGYIRTDIDVKIIARMRVNQVELGFNTSIFPVAEFNPWKVQIQFLDHFNYGVCTLDGYKLLDEYKKNNNE
jgi:AcrR family transcriptional regulator